MWDFSADGIRASLEESLERLGLDAVDVLYLHDPDEHDLAADLATGVPALAALRDEGLVSAIGIGSKSTEALLAAVRTGALDLVMVAGRYTLLEQAGERGRGLPRERGRDRRGGGLQLRAAGDAAPRRPVRVRRRARRACSRGRSASRRSASGTG